jgi:hypothetical protein
MTLALALILCLQGERKTENVVLVTLDGLRWQEVFSGAEERLLSKELGRVEDVAALKAAFWRETAQARREALMPFLWSVVAGRGQLVGNASKGSVARVTNGFKFSYPGYAEILSGFADGRIDSNKKVPNPNPTVLEWMSKRPGFEGRVAAFCSWDVFPSILNRERSGLPTFAGEAGPAAGPYAELLAEIPTPWHAGSAYDALTFRPALAYATQHAPRVLYIALGETDEWAHAGRYDRYLEAIRREDGYLKILWEALQALPGYAGKTALLVTTDHGRGHEAGEWRDHGKSVAGAERIWIAALGPDVAAAGEREKIADVLQAQLAATLAACVGEDYRGDVPKAAPPVAAFLKP